MSDRGNAFPPILAFDKATQTGWLSNFWRSDVTVFGRTWPTVEHPFQAAKFFGVPGASEHIQRIAHAATPHDAKTLGRSRAFKIRPDWADVSVMVMTLCVNAKFTQAEHLRQVLVGTGTRTLVEGNGHGDRIWGAVWLPYTHDGMKEVGETVWAERRDADGKRTHRLIGRNLLGKTLMVVRRDLA